MAIADGEVPAVRRARPSDEQLVAAYSEHGSVVRAAQVLGVSAEAVYGRLRRLGVDTSGRLVRWTEAEDERLRQLYAAYRRGGQLDELAEQFGRSRMGVVCRARALGVADALQEKGQAGIWSQLSEDDAELLLDRLAASGKTANDFCRDEGFSKAAFGRHMRRLSPDRYEAIIGDNASKQTPYALGRQFEYSCRDQLRRRGYFVMRSPASRSPIDLVAIKKNVPVLFVQCKRSGTLVPQEWNTLYDLAESVGAWPVLAARTSPRKTGWWRLDAKKDGTRKAPPMTAFDIEDPVQAQGKLI